jgi:predicted glycoside hydrolase/deacetylase ChbG (UPF0249 family)
MKDVRFITRADDAGSSHSANVAIAKVIKAGFIKNVSIMAPGDFVSEAANLLAGNKNVLFGMHFTLNAEWDKVKWKPVSKVDKGCWMIDENWYFKADPKLFPEDPPQLELIGQELDAQLEKLTKAGFKISYVDTHMMPELKVKGMDAIVQDFAKKKGLIDHMHYYVLPPGLFDAAKEKNIIPMLKACPDGQYFFLTHPAMYSQEMLQTGNSSVSGEEVAKGRDGEAKMFSRPILKHALKILFKIRPLRYDEAKPLPKRLTPDDVKAELGLSDD